MTQNGILFELQEGGRGAGLTELTELELGGGGSTVYLLFFSIYKA